MIRLTKYIGITVLIFMALQFHIAQADVPPGGTCTSDPDCADVGNQSYGCYKNPSTAATGTCTPDGDAPPATGTTPPPTGTTPPATGTTPPVTGTTNSTSNSGTLENPLNAPDIPTLLNEILAYVRVIGGIFLTLMLVVTGVMFVLARGNPEKVGQARSALMWTAIGGLLLLGAQALASVIAATVQSL